MREHMLYQADWLLRFYGFERAEIMEGARGGMLDLAIDPKLAWALQRREAFPVDINRAPRELLLRVPGLGTRAVDRIIVAGRLGKLGIGDLAQMTDRKSVVSGTRVSVSVDPGGRSNIQQKIIDKH